MHLVENYALTAGVKISKPFINPLFFPLPSEEYITIHSSSGMPSKNYEYYEEVIKLIKPYLSKYNISIVQIGGKEDKPIPNTINYLGKTKLRETFYVLKNSKLHLGNDSFSSHVSAFLKTPTVTLFGATLPSTCKPYWFDESKFSWFAPDFSERKPSYSVEEVEKRVNEIFPDLVAEKVLHHLSIKNDLSGIVPVHLGLSYKSGLVDIVPDFEHNKNITTRGGISIRCDYADNPTHLEYWLSKHKCAIYTDKPLNINLLKKYKENIEIIVLYIHNDKLLDKINDFRSVGKKMQIFYSGDRNISDVRLDFFNENINEPIKFCKKDLDNPAKLCDNSYFESSLKILSNNQIYPCKAYLDKNIPTQSHQKIIDCEDFYNEIEYFKIYNNDNKN